MREEMEVARATALEANYERGTAVKNGNYEGGVVTAARSPERTGDSLQHLREPDGVLAAAQSMHEAQLPPMEERIPFTKIDGEGPTGPACPAKPGQQQTRPPKKMNAPVNLAGETLGSCGKFLFQQLLEVLPLRSQTMGKVNSRSLFPLPTSRSMLETIFPELTVEVMTWLLCICFSLNSLWGDCVWCDWKPNTCQLKCLQELVQHVKVFCALDLPMETLSWDDLFQVRTVDYMGEEVKVARWFTWGNINPALPKEIGTVPLEEVCELGSRFYVEHFENFLKPEREWVKSRAPRVMVEDHAWGRVCSGLVQSGVCCFLEEQEVFRVGDAPLLNGLFGVTKDERTSDNVEIFRLIMNLIPLNNICMPMTGDVDTLPSWGSMSPFFLQRHENLLVSSEDVKCFFYTMKVPDSWVKFLAFNKPVPEEVLPEELKGRQVYLASRVLPMGFLNSVSLAQHVHRNLVKWSGKREHVEASPPVNAPEQELRKDRPFTMANPSWRVYLDNYDLLERVEATDMVELEGTMAPGTLALRQEYEIWNIPRNVKKSVVRSARCEVQGATVDGSTGVAYPRESKLNKYFLLAFSLAGLSHARQKQWQVACGGLVYFSMFRRPLLGSLNQVWSHIQEYERRGVRVLRTPPDCRLELLRFLGLLPLAKLDFRLDMHPQVSCSDASTTGGRICASAGTTSVGSVVAQGGLRGQRAENHSDVGILAIGLFDGIGALRVSLEALGLPVVGYVSVEQHEPARRVVESHYPGVLHYDDVRAIDETIIREWSAKFSPTSLVIIGAGPPCQGVSGLNCDRKGALRDQRSSLFVEVPRIRDAVKRFFKWCPVFVIMESVASMDVEDRQVMSAAFGGDAIKCDAGSLTWCHRPRLYWCDWELRESEGVTITPGDNETPATLILEGNQDFAQVVRQGWQKLNPDKPFPTFTTARPRAMPGRKPAGVQQCSWEELCRWQQDQHRFPPYQYCDDHCLV